jgi:protein RecA
MEQSKSQKKAQKLRDTLKFIQEFQKRSNDDEIFPDLLKAKNMEVTPSSSAIINTITGIGGFPKGRIVEIYGSYSTGKTTIAIESMACVQQNDEDACVLFIDFEHAFDWTYAKKLGLCLDHDKFIYMQPTCLEQGADAAITASERDLVDFIVIDSVAAMTPKSEMEGDMYTEKGTQKGLQAALLSKFLGILTKKITRGKKPPVILINQTRSSININPLIKPFSVYISPSISLLGVIAATESITMKSTKSRSDAVIAASAPCSRHVGCM